MRRKSILFQGTMLVNMASIEEAKFLQRLGARIREQRELRGMTQAQFGKQCGLHRTFIGFVERGERNVAILNLRRIAQALRVPVGDLLK